MYKVILDEDYIKSQAKEMAESVRSHTFEHLKLLISETIKTPLEKKQKMMVIDMFISSFYDRLSEHITSLHRESLATMELEIKDQFSES